MNLRSAHLAIPLAAAALCASAAIAQPARRAADEQGPPDGSTATLIDGELRVRSIRLVGMDDLHLTVIDERGERRVVPIGELIALVPARSATSAIQGIGAVTRSAGIDPETLQSRIDAGNAGFIQTTDGERLIGEPGASAGEEDAITWIHPRFGPVTIDIDRISLFSMPGAGSLALTLESDPDEDVVHLLNGDRLRGLITSLADPIVIEQDDDNATRTEIERDRVAGAALANPTSPRKGMTAWLEDGSVVRVSSVASAAGTELDLALPSGAEGVYSIAELRALGFDSERLLPLSSLRPSDQKAIGDRRTTEPIRLDHHPDDMLTGNAPTLGALDVRFPGPMRVEWALPKGVLRLAATAALAADAAPWGDCEIVILVDGREIFRDRLETGRPVIAINQEIRGDTLTIAIEPGNYGPINDRVTLHRPLLLLAPPRDDSQR